MIHCDSCGRDHAASTIEGQRVIIKDCCFEALKAYAAVAASAVAQQIFLRRYKQQRARFVKLADESIISRSPVIRQAAARYRKMSGENPLVDENEAP